MSYHYCQQITFVKSAGGKAPLLSDADGMRHAAAQSERRTLLQSCRTAASRPPTPALQGRGYNPRHERGQRDPLAIMSPERGYCHSRYFGL
jgi:hypothetical protein